MRMHARDDGRAVARVGGTAAHTVGRIHTYCCIHTVSSHISTVKWNTNTCPSIRGVRWNTGIRLHVLLPPARPSLLRASAAFHPPHASPAASRSSGWWHRIVFALGGEPSLYIRIRAGKFRVSLIRVSRNLECPLFRLLLVPKLESRLFID